MIALAVALSVLAVVGILELIVRFVLVTIFVVIFLVISVVPCCFLPLIWVADNLDGDDARELLTPVCFILTQALGKRLAITSNNPEYTAYLEQKLGA